jgi:hypothetical protein
MVTEKEESPDILRAMIIIPDLRSNKELIPSPLHHH